MAKKKKKQLDIAKEFENAVYVPLETRQQIEEERKKQREQQSRLFDGGSGSIGTKIKNTAADVSLNILKGGLGATEGVSDFMRRRGADVVDWIGWDSKAKQLRNTANQNATEGIASDFEHILYGDLSGSKKDEDIDVYEKMHEKSALTDRSRGIAQSVGYSVTNAAMSTAMGGGNIGSLLLTGVSAGGSAESRAIEQGMDEDDAFIYGVLSGSGEAVSEAFFGGVGKFTKALGYGKGALDDVLIENVTKRIGSNVLRSLTSFGLRAGGEGFEEILSAAFDTAAQKISGMDERSLAEIWQDQNVGQAFTDGVISSMFSSSPRLVSSIATGTNYDNGTTRNEQKVIEDIIDQRTQGQKLSNKERGDLRQQITKDLIDGKIAGSEIDRALQNTETTWNQNKDRYITRTVINENTKFTTTDDDLKIDKKQLNKNANLEDVQNKIKVLEQDFLNANNDVRNTTSSHELFDEMKRMIVATGEQQRLTSNKQMAEDGALRLLTNKKGEPIRNGRGELQYVKADTGQLVTINGYHTKEGMVLNSDSHQIFEATMGHELGESLKANTPEIYKQLRDLAVEVGRADGTLTKETFDAIKSTYGELGTNTDSYLDEYVNDKIGELFKSDSSMFQEIGKKPNIARRLLNEIKYLIQKFTAGSPEQKRLLEAQHNLKKALQESVRNLDVSQETNQQETQQKTDNIQQQTTEDIAPIKEQVKETPKKFTEVTDDDLFNINMEEVENQFDKQEYKLNEDVDDETPFGNYWDLDDYNFKLKDGNTLWIETPREYGKYKNGKTNYQQEIYNKIDFMIEDSNGEIIDEYSIENEKGEFTRDDILNAIKHMTYDDSNKVADGQLDIFDNVHRNDGHRYSLSQDNQGRELTQEQQDYFKDETKELVDDDGRLIELYHGTSEDFTVFDTSKIGENTNNEGLFGKGFYLTNNPELADGYSKYRDGNQKVLKVYAKITNPFVWRNIKTEEQMNQFVKDNNIPEGTIRWNPYQQEIHTITEIENERVFSQALQDAGYDGIIYEYRQQDENSKPVKEIVVFNSNQIKSVDNTNPTSNPDIRYSLSDDIIEQTGSKKGDAHSDFFIDRTTDFDRHQGTSQDGKAFVLRLQKGNNEAKVSLTENDNTIWIDELYVKNQKQGYGKEIVDAIKNYAYDNQKTIKTFKEVGTAREFWNKMFGEDTADGYFSHKYFKGKPEYWQQRIDEVQERIDRFTQWKENALKNGNQKLADLHQESIDNEYKWLEKYQQELAQANENNTRYSLSQDNQGRQLSEQQQEYFKDSKVRDDEGRLLEVYHGTPSQDKFTVFDPNKAGENTLSGEYGLYFTDSKEFADDFSYERLESDSMFFDIKGEKGNVYTNYLNVTNPLDFAKLTKEDISNLYDYASYIGQLDGKERFVEDMLNWQQIGNHQLMKQNIDLKSIADNSNYDGVIAKLNVKGNENEYIVFNSNQIKNADNLNPTKDPDIRYSLSVSEANTGKDNQGRTLSKGMQDFMADSKVTDENGNLIETYHGTNNPGFNIFKPSQGNSQFGKYKFKDYEISYHTASLDTARGYTDIGVEEISPENGMSNIYRDYLNITNPFVVENSSTSDIKSWKNIKDNNIRQFETEYYDEFESKWNTDKKITENLDSINEDLFPFNCELRLNDGYYELYDLGRNDGMGESLLLYVGENDNTSELFYEGLKESIYGENFDDYIYSSDNIVKWVLAQNQKGANYDGIIIPDIMDTGIRGNMFGEPTTDYITFYSNQVKSVDNQNPTENPDIRYSLSSNEINEQKDLQTRINESMTMDDMKRILDMAFVEGDIKEYSDGEVQSVEDWINNDNWNYQISLIAENSQPIIEKYLNRMNEDSGYNEDFTFDDILEAYKNGTLTGPVKQSRIDLDTSIESGRVDNRFYAPQQIEMTKELYDKANQRVTNKNRDEVYKARADFIIAAHGKGMAEQLGLSQQEINKKLRSWANYPQDAVNISNRVNEGVARENQWSGLENSSIVNYISINDDQLKSMVKEIKGESSEFERKYITSAMLAIDTHIDYSTLTFEFGQGEALSQKHANGDYDYTTDTIRVNRAAQNTIAHEMGHYINSKWARDIFGSNPMGSPLSDLALHYNKDIFKLSNEQKQFVDNFTMFIDDLTDSAVLSYGNNRGIDYWQNRDEVFARFVAKFTEWTKNKATNGRFDYESRYNSGFGDAFTTKQYMDFVKILQEKSALETMGDRAEIQHSLSNPNDIAPFGEGIKSEQIKPRDIQQTIQNSVQEAIAPIREQIQQIADEVVKSENLDDIELNLEPFMDMINGDNGQVLSNINKNYDQIMTNLQEQGLPKDVAQNFLQNMVHKYDQAFNRVKQRMTEKQANKVQKMILDAQEKFTNRNAIIDKLAKDSGNQMIKYKGDLANNSFGQAQYNVQIAQTDLNGNEIGKGIDGLFEQAEKQGLGAVLDDYLFHKSNIERHAVGKGSQVPASVSEQLVRDYEKSYPQLKEWSKGFEKYFDNLLQLEVDSGLIDQDTYNLLRGEEGIYRSYVPFYENESSQRYFDDAGNLKPIKPLKRAKGGANQSKLMGMKQAMTKQTMAVWNSMRTNQLYQEIINTLGGEEGLGFIVRNDPSNLSQSLYTDQDGNKFLTAYVNGQEMSTKISDELYNELSKKSENAIKEFEDKYSLITKPLQGLSNFRRNILTSYNPIFALYKNPIKDIGDATLYSKHTAQMLKGLLPSYYQLLRNKTKEAKQFRALYGGGEYSGFGKGYARVSEIIELAPRFAEFKASLKAGESVEQALYNARDITTNFGRGGYITKALNRNGATFLNASVQGFSKFYRNFAEQPNAGQFAMAVGKAAMLGIVPALINELAFGSGDDKDEDYEALPDYIKDNYYLFKKRDGDFIRVPKGRALSVMGSAARRTLERIEGEEDAFDGYLKNAWSQIGPVEIGGNPLDNTIIAPLVQAWNPFGEKKSGGNTPGRAWYGGDIVPYRLQGERPEDQSDASVDKMSIWLGEKLGISPYKVNYVIDQYTGGLGDLVLPMLTEETNSGAETPLEYAIAPIKDQVVVNSIDDNKYASEFYSTKEKLYTGSKATDKDLLKAQYMDDVSFDLSALYKEKREIQANEKLDKKTKYAKVQQIQKQINEIAKEGLDNYEDITLTNNYASVGDDRAYYKNTKGKWTAIKADELNTIETLGLTDSEKSSYFDVKNKIYNLDNDYKTKKEGKSEAEQIKLGIQQKKDRIETIKSSTLPDRAKYAMFDTKYDDKLLPYYEDLGFKANDIMTYKSQTFAADKDKYGDSISGSKKTKVLDYINSMNIPYEQKLILWKKEYKTDNTYDRQIVSYIDSHISDYSSKKAVLEELGYEVNGNDIISANIAKKIRKKNNKK